MKVITAWLELFDNPLIHLSQSHIIIQRLHPFNLLFLLAMKVNFMLIGSKIIIQRSLTSGEETKESQL